MTLALIIVLVLFGFVLQMAISKEFRKVVSLNTYKWFILLLILDVIFTLTFIISIQLAFPLILQKIFKYGTLVLSAAYYITYMKILNADRNVITTTAFIGYVLSMFVVVFFGQLLGNILFVVILTFWIALTCTKRKYPSAHIKTLAYILIGAELLRYIVESIIIYELVFLKIENIWLIGITFLIKTVSVLFVIEIKNNISINKNLAKALDFHSSLIFLDLILNEDRNAIVLTDINQKIVYVNPHTLKLTGYTEAEIIGKKPNIFSSGQTEALVYEEMYKHLSQFKSWQGEFINKKKSGEIFIEGSKIVTLFDVRNKPMFFLAIKTDVTVEKSYLKKLEYHSKYEELTGLFRRNYFYEILKERIEDDNKSDHYLILIDIDKLKKINDTYGHQTGDNAIIHFSKILKEVFTHNAILCRFGGDEFAIYIYDINEEIINKFIKELHSKLFNKPLICKNNTITLVASVGYTLIDKPFNFKESYDKADIKLYKSKEKKRN